jgi:hypothetical protein
MSHDELFARILWSWRTRIRPSHFVQSQSRRDQPIGGYPYQAPTIVERGILLGVRLDPTRGITMRVVLLALSLSTGAAALCQSAAPAPTKPERSGENSQGAQLGMDCKKLTPDLSIPSFAPRIGDRRSSAPAPWHWDEVEADSKNIFHLPFFGPERQINSKNAFPSAVLNSEAMSCTLVAQSGVSSFDRRLFRQWPNAKLEPIPTQWPNARFEQIPTGWSGLKKAPITSQLSTPTTDPNP